MPILYNVSKDNDFAVAADLGLDKLLVYRLDPEKGSLTANDPAFARIKLSLELGHAILFFTPVANSAM